ncbi:Predicted O-linked N-acetylglucosamine transferase, SPINDLY family [Legionella donaldsonii]|uniref:Predicted O-linked N-acetylglucosamine transferase, SPINDLY family n=1 Tax=Legionella donaldsonii TaxID=45060 RepID=A0A378J836_9GAMM|nr:tetratricopeptide repeat protein [Legionella donaldsonii]STX43943.1 Predicted O-linked N-acetylglucosamine transferase, SPINDLY family [Legionella donaldsonii]
MQLSKFILILISSFFFINTAFSQEKPIEPKTIALNSEEQVKTILRNFSLLNWESKEKNLPIVLDKINQVKSKDEKSLLLARLYTIFPGKNDTNLNKAHELIENYLKMHPESHEGYLIYARIIREEHDLDFFRYRVAPSTQEIQENINYRKNALFNIEKSLKIKQTAEGYLLKAVFSDGDERIELLEKSISLDSNYYEAWRELIYELKSRHRYDEALSRLGEWIKSSQATELKIEILRKFAGVLKDQREPKKAIQVLNYALSARKKTGTNGLETSYSGIDGIYLDLARAYKDAKDTQHSVEYYQKYLVLDPKSWYVRFELAKLYHDHGLVNKAITQYEQVLAYHENDTSAIYNLGLLYEKIDEEKAKELFIKYIKLEINKEDEDSIKWVERAKSELQLMGVYNYPQSKKELKYLESKSSSFSKWLFLLLLLPFFWKYKKATRFIIVSSMTAAVVFISIIEAEASNPSLVKAFLYFIPVICTGTFLLYVFRKQQ